MDVYCLCAEWCGVCREFKPSMDELRLPGVALHWIDVEEEPEWGDLQDITSFPILVIKEGGKTVFTGSVEPHLPHIRRLLLSIQREVIRC